MSRGNETSKSVDLHTRVKRWSRLETSDWSVWYMTVHEAMSTGTTTTYPITSTINCDKTVKNLMKIKICRPKMFFGSDGVRSGGLPVCHFVRFIVVHRGQLVGRHFRVTIRPV